MLEIDDTKNIPLMTLPGVFGLHSNAEIQYYTNTAKEIMLGCIQMQTSDSAASGGSNREEQIETVANEIQDKLPELFDFANIQKSLGDEISPT